ncbi:hypothetical protein DM860_008395 [Cuscuta australis]|uniref:H15 domain-containing protein n=1 Tax=Cuscuta australis TaxID=267555 RepID=A0A328D3F0_9ASTE|nr:hypothetical protein DM860_008395 [Cuscuta australis]
MFPSQEMDRPTPAPLPTPATPPVNHPEKADFESQNCNEEGNSASQNFRALMMRLAIASSPYKSLTPTQSSIFEEKLRQCFPYLNAPDHPPYSWMIRKAIEDLNEESGSSEEAISECIVSNNPELPWAHSALLKHHLTKLCEKGDIVRTRDGLYLIKEQNTPVPVVSSSPSSSSTCSLSFSPSVDYMDSDSTTSGGCSKRKGRKMKRKPKKVGIKKRKQRPTKKRNIHLVRKRKVRGRLPKKGKRKGKAPSDEETIDAVEEANQMEWQDMEMTEQEVKQVRILDAGELLVVPTDVGTEEQNPGVEDGSDVIEAENDEDEHEMMEGQDPSGLEHNDSQREAEGQNGLLNEKIKMNAEEDCPGLQHDVEESSLHSIENQTQEENVMEEEGDQEEFQVEADNAEIKVKNQDQDEQDEENHPENTKEEKMDWECGTDVTLKEKDDRADKTNLVNDTTDTESPKKLGDEKEKQGMVRVLRKCQNRRKEIVLPPNTEEHGAGRCLRSRKKIKPEQILDTVQTSIGTEVPKYEGISLVPNVPEDTDIKHNSQHEQEMVVCEEHSQVEAEMVEPDNMQLGLQFPTDEAEEIMCCQSQQNNMNAPKVEEQQEPDSPEDSKQELSNQRQLRHRISKTEPGTEDQKVLQGGLSLPETRRVTRKMAAATASCISPLLLVEKQKTKHSKSQVDVGVSTMPRRSARLSIGPSKK